MGSPIILLAIIIAAVFIAILGTCMIGVMLYLFRQESEQKRKRDDDLFWEKERELNRDH